jgi:hypothetical protein
MTVAVQRSSCTAKQLLYRECEKPGDAAAESVERRTIARHQTRSSSLSEPSPRVPALQQPNEPIGKRAQRVMREHPREPQRMEQPRLRQCIKSTLRGSLADLQLGTDSRPGGALVAKLANQKRVGIDTRATETVPFRSGVRCLGGGGH